MAKKDQQGNWLDFKGRAIHPDLIPGYDKKRDRIVESLVNKALKLEIRMKEDKAKVNKGLDRLVESLAKETGTTPSQSGAITFNNFDQTMKVSVSVPGSIEFDERFSAAESLIHQYLDKLLTDADKNIRALVEEAFRRDKKNNLNRDSIIRLMKVNIKDEKWLKAMELIRESMHIAYGKSYIYMEVRPVNGEWRKIHLNFSSLEAR